MIKSIFNEKISNMLEYPSITINDSFLYTHNRVFNLYYNDETEKFLFYNEIEEVDLNEIFEKITGQSLYESKFILSYGANASIKYLHSKLNSEDVFLPVIKVRLTGYDIVYSNYFCEDGTLPHTIVESKDCEIDVFIYPILDNELKLLNKSEAVGVDYDLISISSNVLENNYFNVDELLLYECKHGGIKLSEEFVSVLAITGNNRISKEVSQYEILKTVINEKYEVFDIFSFSKRIIDDEEFRTKMNGRLSRNV